MASPSRLIPTPPEETEQLSVTTIALPRLATFALVATLAAGLLATAGPSRAWAEVDVDGIAGAPATETGPDSSRSRLSYQLDPGQQVQDRYYVRNTGTTAQNVTVYATDAFTTGEGAYSLLATTATPTDVGSWLNFDGATQLSFALEPAETRIIPFTLTAPADARPGDHAGGIIVSALSASSQVQLERRVGTRLYARVKGDLQSALSISSISSSYAGSLNPFAGETTIGYTVTNSGNVSLGADVVASVRGLFGIPLSGGNASAVPELLPGETRTITAVVPGVGQWIFLTPTIELAATVDEDALNAGPLPTAKRDTVLMVMPWALLAVILLAALASVAIRLRRRSNDRLAAEWIRHTEEEAVRRAQEHAIR